MATAGNASQSQGGTLEDWDAARFRLDKITPDIEKMRGISGTVGLIYGVVHQGEPLLTKSFGFRDAEKRLPITEDTIFRMCSLSKAVTSSGLGMLVEESGGKFDFDDLVRDHLPSYRPSGTSSGPLMDAKLSHWLSMASGTQPYHCWLQSRNSIVVRPEDAMKAVNSFQAESPLGTNFNYSNWGYEIAAQIIKDRTGQTWNELVHERIFKPLDLKRSEATGAGDDLRNKDEDVAKCYLSLDNGTQVSIPPSKLSGQTVLGAGGGVASCMRDMLTLYTEMLRAYNGKSPDSIFKRLDRTMSHITDVPTPPGVPDNGNESGYGMGWFRTVLPNVLCRSSPNPGFILEEAPILGRGASPRLLLMHYGCMPGTYTIVIMLPGTETVVMVLSNSSGLCDISDYVGQLIVQALFDFPEPHDYVEWVSRAVRREKTWYERVKAELEGLRQHPRDECGTPKPLEKYAGVYINEAGFFKVAVRADKGRLSIRFVGGGDDEDSINGPLTLRHYEDDTFSWLTRRDNLVEKGRWTLQLPESFLIRFEEGPDGEIARLKWKNDPNPGARFERQPEVFLKQIKQ